LTCGSALSFTVMYAMAIATGIASHSARYELSFSQSTGNIIAPQCTIGRMDLATGLSALNSSRELLRALRERLKNEDLKREEVIGRIGEIYDYIVDSKDALVDAKDEIYALKEKLARKNQYEHRFSVLWRKGDDGKYVGPFCPICNGNGKEMPMRPAPGYDQTKEHFNMACNVHHPQAIRPTMPVTYQVPKSEVPVDWCTANPA